MSEGRVLRRDIAKDTVLSFHDVDAVPAGIVERLWREQQARWFPGTREVLETVEQVPAGGMR